jgi:hypothetical protein
MIRDILVIHSHGKGRVILENTIEKFWDEFMTGDAARKDPEGKVLACQ